MVINTWKDRRLIFKYNLSLVYITHQWVHTGTVELRFVNQAPQCSYRGVTGSPVYTCWGWGVSLLQLSSHPCDRQPSLILLIQHNTILYHNCIITVWSSNMFQYNMKNGGGYRESLKKYQLSLNWMIEF